MIKDVSQIQLLEEESINLHAKVYFDYDYISEDYGYDQISLIHNDVKYHHESLYVRKGRIRIYLDKIQIQLS